MSKTFVLLSSPEQDFFCHYQQFCIRKRKAGIFEYFIQISEITDDILEQ